jgi:hypothetical protein
MKLKNPMNDDDDDDENEITLGSAPTSERAA